MDKESTESENGVDRDGVPVFSKKRPYRKPCILSVEMLEVVAATCDGSKAEFTGFDDCGTASALQS